MAGIVIIDAYESETAGILHSRRYHQYVGLAFLCCPGDCTAFFKKKESSEKNEVFNTGRIPDRLPVHGTIFAIGISRISSAPQALSCGISWFTAFFGTTVWML